MPFTRGEWKRSARRGGPLWEAAGWLVLVAVVIGIIKGCTGTP